MTNCDAERLEILAQIKVAFADRDTPAIAEISAGEPNQGHEYAYCQEFFGGRQWQEISYADVLEKYPSGPSASITFLSETGFAYYLPLFMSCILEKFYESGDLLESLLPELKTNGGPVLSGEPLIQVSLLNSPQKRCVAQFLSFLARCHAVDLPEDIYGDAAPNIVLSVYWSSLLSQPAI